MKKILQKAFLEVSKLPPEEQELIASKLLKELASKQRKEQTSTPPVRQPQTMRWQYLKQIIEDNTTPLGRVFDLFIQFLIIASLVTFSIETIPDISPSILRALALFELITMVIFTIEYLLRLMVADKKLKFVFSFFGLVDFLSIAPFYLTLGVDLRSLRALRLLRLFRILKLVRYSMAMRRFAVAFQLAREELLLFGATTGLLLFLAATGIYHFEHDAQPEAFESIFTSLWWAVSTLTTVGYGDIYPITTGGRIFTFFVLLLGLGVISVPSGLIASALSRARELEEEEQKQRDLIEE